MMNCLFACVREDEFQVTCVVLSSLFDIGALEVNFVKVSSHRFSLRVMRFVLLLVNLSAVFPGTLADLSF